MEKKLLCGILAALMLFSATACTPGGMETPTQTNPATTSAPDCSEAPTEVPTEGTTEPETEPPIEIEVPAYEDIGLTGQMLGIDQRLRLHYSFADYSYSQLRSDNTLVFTSNKDYVVNKDGLTLTDAGWNSVGFAHTLVEPYTAMAALACCAKIAGRRGLMCK